MIAKLLHSAHRTNRWLDRQFGPPYRILLAIGLTIEIGYHIREVIVAAGDADHIIRSASVIVLATALLISTLAELYDRLARRKMQRST